MENYDENELIRILNLAIFLDMQLILKSVCFIIGMKLKSEKFNTKYHVFKALRIRLGHIYPFEDGDIIKNDLSDFWRFIVHGINNKTLTLSNEF